ncbi:MAG: hypothetical protein ACSW8D_11385, partial [Prevotella sp.]
NLSDAQYEAAYEINLDYLMGVTSQYDVFGPYWERRNMDLSYILFSWQWDLFRAATYFYRPLVFEAGYWHFSVYARYPHRDYFFFGRPHFYASYRGGHSWRMNGGRSFYEGRRDFYRPGNPSRDHHFGMRSGWDRGDYHNPGRHSSTHITGGNGHSLSPTGRDGHNGGYSIGGSRSGSHPGGFGSGRNGNMGNDNRPAGGNPSVDGNRPAGGNPSINGNHPTDNNRPMGGSRSSGGSFNNNQPSVNHGSSSSNGGGFRQGGGSSAPRTSNSSSVGGSRSGGSFNSGSSRSGSAVSGGSRSSSSGNTRSSGGSVSGGSRSSGSSSNSHGNFGGGRH